MNFDQSPRAILPALSDGGCVFWLLPPQGITRDISRDNVILWPINRQRAVCRGRIVKMRLPTYFSERVGAIMLANSGGLNCLKNISIWGYCVLTWFRQAQTHCTVLPDGRAHFSSTPVHADPFSCGTLLNTALTQPGAQAEKVHVCLKYRQSQNLHGHTKLGRFFSKVGVEKAEIGGSCDHL